MPASPRHRALTAQLGEWSPQQIAALLERRPDLVQPQPPDNVSQLAQRAQDRSSVRSAVTTTTLAENRLLQVVVCCRPEVPLDDLCAALPEGVGLADVEAPLASLESAALVWRHEGRLHCSASLRHAMPTTLGPPLHLLVNNQTVDYLKSALRWLRTAIDERGLGEGAPARATGPERRPPRKAELVGEMESLLSVPELVDAVLATGTEECAGIATAMAAGHPTISVSHPMYFSTYSPGAYYTKYPTYWLYQRGMVLPLDGRTATQPREVGVALRGGRPVAELAIDPPVLATGPVDRAEVDVEAAGRAIHTLHQLADLLEHWAEAPAKALKSGGLGVTALKQAGAALDADPAEIARLVELGSLAGLLDTTTAIRKEGRRSALENFVGPSPAAACWVGRPVDERWSQLTTAWLRAEHWPSASGRKSPDRKTAPVMSVQYAVGAPDRRRDVLDVLASLDPGARTTADALAASVYWRRPQPWLDLAVGSPATVIHWVHDEAQLLGLVASGALSAFGRALLAGDSRGAKRSFQAALPEAATSFMLQADLTATVVGALDRDLLVELRLLADIESKGGASTFRFSESSLARAIDAGRDTDTILAFLEAHATKGVPKPLAYLVADVARRYGHLHVGSAESFVTSDDPAVLADACSHRRTRKLALRLVAPTVAVSPHLRAKVIGGLRDGGFLPTGDDEEGGLVRIQAPAIPTPGSRGAASPGDRLPEPFRSRSGRPISALDAGTAARLAEDIVAGRAPADTGYTQRERSSPPAPPALFDLDGDLDGDLEATESLDAVLESAFDNSRVLALVLEDGEQLTEPILFAVTGREPDRVIGIDLDDGTTMTILNERIVATADLGPVDELTNVVALRSGRNRPERRRSPRGRRR